MNSFAMGILAVVVLIGVGIIASFWFVVRCLAPLRRKDPCCANCRYPVEGNTTMVCPECGTDLRRVGILSPFIAIQGTAILPLAICGWLFLVTMGTGLLLTRVALPKAFLVSTHNAAAPRVSRYSSIDIWCNDTASSTRPFMLMARINGATAHPRLELDLRSSEFLLVDEKGAALKRGNYDGPRTVAALLSAAGLDPASIASVAEETEIHEFIQAAIDAPQGRHAFRNDGAFRVLSPGSLSQPTYRLVGNEWDDEIIILCIGTLTAALGSAAIYRRRKLLLARARAA